MPRSKQWTKVCQSGLRIDDHTAKTFVKVTVGQDLSELQINAINGLTAESSIEERGMILNNLMDVIDKCSFEVIPTNVLPCPGSIVQRKSPSVNRSPLLYYVTRMEGFNGAPMLLGGPRLAATEYQYHLAPLHKLCGATMDQALQQDDASIYSVEFAATRTANRKDIQTVRLIVSDQKKETFSIINARGQVFGTFDNVSSSNLNQAKDSFIKSGNDLFKVEPVRNLKIEGEDRCGGIPVISGLSKAGRTELLRRRLRQRTSQRKSAYAVTLAQVMQLLHQLYQRTKKKYAGAVDLNARRIVEYAHCAVSHQQGDLPSDRFNGYPFLFLVPDIDIFPADIPLPGMRNSPRENTYSAGDLLLMVPYLYKPTILLYDGIRYSIPRDLQQRVKINTFIALKLGTTTSQINIDLTMLLKKASMTRVFERFEHYHSRGSQARTMTCWGSLATRMSLPNLLDEHAFSSQGMLTVGGYLRRIHRTLLIINADSPGNSIPQGLPRLNTIISRCTADPTLMLGRGVDMR